MHRIVIGARGGQITDHIDGNRLNNTRTNLRIACARENALNRKKARGGSSSRFKGVNFQDNAGRWRARIGNHGTLMHLGLFDCEKDAARAYNEAAKRHFGQFARLNEILD